MPTMREYFDREAADYLRRLSNVLGATNGDSAITELYRLARALRGVAQLAREDHVSRAAGGLEAAARALVDRNAAWDEAARAHLRKAVTDLTALTTDRDDEQRESRVAAVLDACSAVTVNGTPHALQEQPAPDAEHLRQEFREYVANEAEEIARVLDDSMGAFGRDPMDREALRAVLRRHRALLGAARLDEVRIVAETLRAVEDIAGVIIKINAPVKKEWLDVFRCARDVLRKAAEPLRQDEEPRSSSALSRLRTLHEELLDRYSDKEAAPAASPAEPLLAGVATMAETRTSADTDIAELCYRGPAALQRAMELRPRLEQVLRDEPGSRELLDELFDLIRLGLE